MFRYYLYIIFLFFLAGCSFKGKTIYDNSVQISSFFLADDGRQIISDGFLPINLFQSHQLEVLANDFSDREINRAYIKLEENFSFALASKIGSKENQTNIRCSFKRDPSINNQRGFSIEGSGNKNSYTIVFSSSTSTGIRYAVEYYSLNFLGIFNFQPPSTFNNIEVNRTLTNSTSKLPKYFKVINPGPAFDLRIWTGESKFDRGTWLQDEAKEFEIGTQLYQFHHNMFAISEHTSKRYNPSFASELLYEKTIKYIDEFFAKNPTVKSVSLSVSDGNQYEQSNFRLGTKDSLSISDTYYKYINRASDYVADKYPEKYIALMAYSHVRTPPRFRLNDNVIVFLVRDIYEDHQKWKDKAKNFGIYHFAYGRGYIFPNHNPSALKRLIVWAVENNINLYKGELYAAWSIDGPKAWILSNLLWNPNSNIEELLEFYFNSTYGNQAGPLIYNFFFLCDSINSEKVPDYSLPSITKPGLHVFDALSSKVVDQMSELLHTSEKILIGNDNELYRFNIENLLCSWEYFCKYYESYESIYKTTNTTLDPLSQLSRLNQSLFNFQTMRSYYEILNLSKIVPYSFNHRNFSRIDPHFDFLGLDKILISKLMFLNKYIDVRKESLSNELLYLYSYLDLLNTKSNLKTDFSCEFKDLQSLSKFNGSVNWDIFEMYIKRSSFHNYKIDSGFLSVTGVGDVTGLILKRKLKTNKTYKFSLEYKTNHPNCFVEVRLTNNRSRRILLEMGGNDVWSMATETFTFSVDDKQARSRIGTTFIISLNKSQNMNSLLELKSFKIEEYE